MNRVFSTVWNHSLGAWVVASEHAARQGKRGARRIATALTVTGLGLGAPLHSLAADLPSGGQIVHGSGQIGAATGNQLVIGQNSNQLAINWQSFDIADGHQVTFNQPGADAVALNRVLGADGSKIMGQLDANGRVFIVNPNGVLFGKGAAVNVGGLVASTLDLSVEDFAAGNYQFKGDGSNQAVVNQGSISAANGGAVALLGGTVSNQGVIVANQGSVALAAGNKVTLDFAGDGLLNVQVDEAVVDALVENRQLIKADGGQVLLTAHAGEALLKTVVNNTGVIEAQTLGEKDGKIVLLGGFDGGTVQVAGTLDASAPKGGNGGFVETSGAHVKIADTAKVTTQAENGSTGTWLIDPNDFTIAASGGDMSGAAVSLAVQSNHFEIQTATMGTTGGNGDIHVNDAISWSSDNRLTLSAERNINIKAPISATGNSAGLVFKHGGDYRIGAPVTLSGANASLSINGQGYTLIHDVDQLQAIDNNLGGSYALAEDIDASATATWNAGAGFKPLGVSDNGAAATVGFRLAGLGHSIDGLSINRPQWNYVGLMGVLAGEMRDLGLSGGSISGGQYVGGLVGWHYSGTISNAYVTGTVNGNDYVGGLVGKNDGTLSSVYVTGTVTGRNYVGGLVGTNNDTLSNAYTTGTVTGSGYYAGGLVGENYGTIRNAYATGTVTGSSGVGGLVGYNVAGSISNSYWDQDSTGQAQAVGNQLLHPGVTELTAANRYNHASYANLGTWAETASGSGIWVASVGTDKQWIMIEGQTRPFLFSEYSTTVRNAHQLQLMAYDLSADYTLANDIDASATAGSNASGMWSSLGFSPIGNNSNLYSGTFDGLGHAISGLTIARPLQDYVGLFGSTRSTGTLRNIGLLGGTVEGRDSVGGLVGYNDGEISNAYATSAVSGSGDYVGGLVGYIASGTISNAYATGTVTGSSNVGGLVGYNFAGTISNAYATGMIRPVTGAIYVGGLVGRNTGTISASFWDTQSTGQAHATGNQATPSGATALTSAQMKSAASFSGWDIATEGGSASVWRIYEGYSAPLLRSFLKAVTVSANPASITSKTYDGSIASGTFTYTPSLAGALLNGPARYASTSANAGTYSTANGGLSLGGLYSGQQGYDISYTGGGSLTITPKALSWNNLTVNNKVYDGSKGASISGGSLTGMVGGETLTSVSSAMFSDKNAGTGKTVTVNTTLGNGGNGGLASNYTISNPTGVTANINQATISSVTNVVADSKVYDGGTAVTFGSATATFNGMVSGDNLAIGATTASFSNKNAGTGKLVNISFLTLSGADAGNYLLASTTATGTGTITPKALTITGMSALDKVYDGNTMASVTGGALSGLISGEMLGVTGLTLRFDNKNAGTGKAVIASGATLADGTGLASNYTISNPTGLTASITPKAITGTIVAANKTYDGTTAATTYGSFGGVFAADSLSLSTTGSFTDKNAGTGKTVTVSAVLAGADAGNYLLSPNINTTTTANITPKAITGTIVADNKTYDGTTAAATSGSLVGVIAGDNLSLSTSGSFTDKNAGTGKTVTVSGVLAGADAGNYLLSPNATATASINKAAATITANNASRTYNGLQQNVAGFTASGLLNGEQASVLTGVSTAGGSGTNAGTYRLIASGADGNYLLTFDDGALTIDKAAATVTANSATHTYNGLQQSVAGFTASGLVNGEQASVLSGVTTSGGSGANAGTYNLITSGADGNYVLTFVDGALTITKAAATVTANSATRSHNGLQQSVAGFTASGLVNGEQASVLSGVRTTGGSGTTAGTYAHSASGVDGNYALTFVDGALTINDVAPTPPAGPHVQVIAGTIYLTNGGDSLSFPTGQFGFSGGPQIPKATVIIHAPGLIFRPPAGPAASMSAPAFAALPGTTIIAKGIRLPEGI
ncbi:YDG domain-containing protein [Pseudomonas sp. LS44]|uniref:YDG domain-containing protein n=1 Tax=Pseudomonas sp. LS44 TaxID=1357074 RepID=UPI00215ACD93|nr:YDG domain-containing protein [Pseudomonas sp. LS44]UVE18066.1 YDG domain-containing protein [Pseudomonas sp. LS44]